MCVFDVSQQVGSLLIILILTMVGVGGSSLSIEAREGNNLSPQAITPLIQDYQRIDNFPDSLGLVRSAKFGASAVGLGDVNQDGFLDILVGASDQNQVYNGITRISAGAAYVLSLNVDGTIRSIQEISSVENGFTRELGQTERFGRQVANIGDLDGNGVTDVAVAANRTVFILFLANDFSVLRYQEISATEGNLSYLIVDNDLFGQGLTGLGDLDGDQVPDLAVGVARGEVNGITSGLVLALFLNSDGTVKSFQEITPAGYASSPLTRSDYFGTSLANLGDVDSDGLMELAIGADGYASSKDSGPGEVFLASLNSDGTPAKMVETITQSPLDTPPPDAQHYAFGNMVSNAGDVDKDGVTDLLVGDHYNGPDAEGVMHLLLLNSDLTVKRQLQMYKGHNGLDDPELYYGADFGVSAVNIGDLNSDGVSDILVGASGLGVEKADGYYSYGGAYTLFLNKQGNVAPSWNMDTEYEIDENSENLTVAGLVAINPDAGSDNGGDTLFYTITGGADGDRFVIDAPDSLQLRQALDYENPADTDKDNIYEVELSVTDNGDSPAAETILLEVRVRDIQEEDVDGVMDVIEQAAPNGGDANDDGLPDDAQSDVASLVTPTGQYLSLDTNGCNLSNVRTSSVSGENGYTFPFGVVGFEAECAFAEVTAYLYTPLNPDFEVRKYSEAGSFLLSGAEVEEVFIDQQLVTKITYTVEDGDILDVSPAGDGRIEDPFGIAVARLADNAEPTINSGEEDKPGAVPTLIRTGGAGY